jgi:aldose 1-epimerase
MDHSVSLASGPLAVELVPSVGGAISRFDYIDGDRRTPVLRPAPNPLQNIRQASCFPLTPFANRIRGGRFHFRGREVHLAPRFPGEPLPIHGQGCLAGWSVEPASANAVVLAFSHSPDEWPWAYESRQHFTLGENCLTIRLTCRNLSSEQMPCGLGLHPGFTCSAGTRIQTSAEEVLAVDESCLPVERLPATGRYDISDNPICSRDLNNGYCGWSGRAIFTDADWPFELELSSPDARFLQIYSPAGAGSFDAEPVSHANAALNEPEEDWPALGIQLLEPQEEASFEMRLEVRVK